MMNVFSCCETLNELKSKLQSNPEIGTVFFQLSLSFATTPFERLSVGVADANRSYFRQLSNPNRLFSGGIGRTFYSAQSMMIISHGLQSLGDAPSDIGLTVGVESALTFPSYLVYRSKMNGHSYIEALRSLTFARLKGGWGPFFLGNLAVTFPAVSAARGLARYGNDALSSSIELGAYSLIAGLSSTVFRNIAVKNMSTQQIMSNFSSHRSLLFAGSSAAILREAIYGMGLLVIPKIKESV